MFLIFVRIEKSVKKYKWMLLDAEYQANKDNHHKGLGI